LAGQDVGVVVAYGCRAVPDVGAMPDRLSDPAERLVTAPCPVCCPDLTWEEFIRHVGLGLKFTILVSLVRTWRQGSLVVDVRVEFVFECAVSKARW
jgi:hypothetical protein